MSLLRQVNTQPLPSYFMSVTGITIVNWTAHQRRLDDDERIQRKKQEMGKDDKEQVKKKQRDPKEISYLRFNANLDLVDWGMHRLHLSCLISVPPFK